MIFSHESTSFGLGSLMGAFASPAVAQSFNVFHNYMPAALLPPVYYPPLPPEPYLHLPEQLPPVVVGTGFMENIGAIFPLVTLTSIWLGIGAVAGICVSGCMYRPKTIETIERKTTKDDPLVDNIPKAFNLDELLQLT